MISTIAISAQLVAGAVALALGAMVALRTADRAETRVFVLLALSTAAWCFATGFEAYASAAGAKLLWGKLTYLGSAFTPTLWLLLILYFTGRTPRDGRLNALLFVVPLATLLLVLFNERTLLVWRRVEVPTVPLAPLELTHGPWFWGVHVPWSYLAITLATLMLAQGFRASRSIYRRQHALMLTAGVVPLVWNLPYLLGLELLGPLDPTPVGLGLAGILVALALLRFQLFDLTPIAHRAVFQSLPDSVFVVDPGGTILDLNPAAAHALGAPPEALVGSRAESIIPRWGDLIRRRRANEDDPTAFHEIDLTWAGQSRSLEVRVVPLRDERGRLLGHAVISHDASRRKAYEAMALRDPLTGLGNRRLYEMRAREVLRSSTLEGHEVAVLYLDLDGFKPVNDRFGHALGDAVLREIAERFAQQVRPGDLLVRLGGDEFAVLLPSAGREVAMRVAERLAAAAGEPLETLTGLRSSPLLDDDVWIDGDAFRLSVSIGVALHPKHGRDPDLLLRRADAAMYRAKQRKRGIVL